MLLGQEKTSQRKPARGWQSAYARHRGCDRSYICRKIKEGLPFDPADPKGGFAEADRWLTEHSPEGVGHKSGRRGGRDGASEKLSPLSENGAAMDGGDVESIVGRVRLAEHLAWVALADAARRATQGAGKGVNEIEAAEIRVSAASSLPGLRRNHAAAARAVVDVERRWHELRLEAGEVGRFDFLRDLLRRRLDPVARRLSALPQHLAHKVNPEKPIFAQKVLESEFAAVRAEIDVAWNRELEADDEAGD